MIKRERMKKVVAWGNAAWAAFLCWGIFTAGFTSSELMLVIPVFLLAVASFYYLMDKKKVENVGY